jgi:vacuolar-type H+-ATPase subunit I/STV1
MSLDSSPGRRAAPMPDTTRSGWYGWIAFAAIMMLMLGVFHAVAGLVALFRDDYFLVTQSGLVIDASYTTWGWTHLILGILVAAAGAALVSGATWARVVAVVAAMLSAVVNLAFLSAYPLWSVIMIALDILVIYAVTAHGDPSEWS